MWCRVCGGFERAGREASPKFLAPFLVLSRVTAALFRGTVFFPLATGAATAVRQWLAGHHAFATPHPFRINFLIDREMGRKGGEGWWWGGARPSALRPHTWQQSLLPASMHSSCPIKRPAASHPFARGGGGLFLCPRHGGLVVRGPPYSAPALAILVMDITFFFWCSSALQRDALCGKRVRRSLSDMRSDTLRE